MDAKVDISDVYLPGEEDNTVPVYETCNEVRRKIRAHLSKCGVTQAQFCRDICAQFHLDNGPANIQAAQLSRFLSARGPRAGTKSIVFYGAYLYFEKIRIKQGKCKSRHRLDMERLWPKGLPRDRDSRTESALPNPQYVPD